MARGRKFVDLVGVAQAVYAVEALVPTESKEAQLLRAAALRFERLLRRRRDKLSTEKPFMTKDARARFDKDIEVVRRYTHLLNAEARVALAVRDAFDGANESYAGNHKIPTRSQTHKGDSVFWRMVIQAPWRSEHEPASL
jgi:hypothetical protein